ncbi:MAG: hypothetical protein ABIG71_00990 [Candidatus Uhrbacteria bacterium]
MIAAIILEVGCFAVEVLICSWLFGNVVIGLLAGAIMHFCVKSYM